MGASKAAQLDDNLKACDVALSAEELDALDGLTRPAAIYPNWSTTAFFDAQAKKALDGG